MASYLRKTDREYRRAFEVAESIIRGYAERGVTLSYGELGEAIAKETGKRLGHNSYGPFLDDLNAETWGQTGVVLSAVVVNSDTGQPGSGFLKLLADRGHLTAGEDESAVIEREQRKVFEWARTGERIVRADPDRAQKIAEQNRRRRGPA